MVAKKGKSKKLGEPSTEFLIQTLASIQSALTSIDKESSAKTEALAAVLENINSMTEMMKHFHDQALRDAAKIIELDGEIRALRTETRVLNNGDDIKEVKYALQKLADAVTELKVAKQTKEELQQEEIKEEKNSEKKEEPKKWNIITFIKKVTDGLNNLKSVLIISLIIILLLASLIYGPSVIQIFIDILKAIFKFNS